MIKEQEMLEKELKENFEKDIDTIRNHITSLRLIGVGLSNTLNEKDKEIERLNNIINELENYIRARVDDDNTCSICSVMIDDLLNILEGSDKE